MSNTTVPARTRALVVINTGSRHGRERADTALGALTRAGIALTTRRVTSPAELSPLIQSLNGAVDQVILGGGDGTMNAAAPALAATKLPLGILPLGTANDLARTLGIPTDLDRAVDVIKAGHTRRIDLGRVNGRLFFNVASLGLSVHLTQRLTKASKRRWGPLSYALTLLRILAHARPFTAEIGWDGETIKVKTVQITVGNGRYYGGGFAVEKDARIDDHQLDLYSLEARSWWQLALIAPWLRSGRHGAWEHVRTLASQSLEIRTRRPQPVNTDGEITTQTPARFDILPGAVTVFAPRPTAITPSKTG